MTEVRNVLFLMYWIIIAFILFLCHSWCTSSCLRCSSKFRIFQKMSKWWLVSNIYCLCYYWGSCWKIQNRYKLRKYLLAFIILWCTLLETDFSSLFLFFNLCGVLEECIIIHFKKLIVNIHDSLLYFLFYYFLIIFYSIN